MNTTFYLPRHVLKSVGESEGKSDDAAQGHESTSYCWIVQTAERLREKGLSVHVSSEVPEQGVVVFCAHHRQYPLAMARQYQRLTTIAVRADAGPTFSADFEVLPNRKFADDESRFFIPHWPQPNLISRDPNRGFHITTVGYKGQHACLHPDFHSERWHHFLAKRGVIWLPECPVWQKGVVTTGANYCDFSRTDLILAVRPHYGLAYPHKSPQKLINAWHAGVPALLGPEVGFRDLRKGELDYIEIRSLSDAEAAVDRLLEQPTLYGRMIERCHQMASVHSVDAIAKQWIDVLERAAEARRNARCSRLPGVARVFLGITSRREYGGFGIRRFIKDLRQGHVQ